MGRCLALTSVHGARRFGVRVSSRLTSVEPPSTAMTTSGPKTALWYPPYTTSLYCIVFPVELWKTHKSIYMPVVFPHYPNHCRSVRDCEVTGHFIPYPIISTAEGFSYLLCYILVYVSCCCNLQASVIGNDATDACTYCKDMVSDVKNFLESNQTQVGGAKLVLTTAHISFHLSYWLNNKSAVLVKGLSNACMRVGLAYTCIHVHIGLHNMYLYGIRFPFILTMFTRLTSITGLSVCRAQSCST